MNIADHAIGGRAVAGPDRRGRRHDLRTASCTRASQRVAALLHQAGLRRGDGVALVLPNRPEFFEITWGCQLSGLYYSAVNTHFTPDEVAYVIDDSEAKAVFIDASMAELGQRILEANDGVDVHISVGGALPGWRPYDDALADGGRARRRFPTAPRCSTRRAPPDGPRPFGGRCPRTARARGRRRCWSTRWPSATA